MYDTSDWDELYNEGIVDFRFHLRNYALANGLNEVDHFVREAELAVKIVFDGFGNDGE
jgi:hypothetical protein